MNVHHRLECSALKDNVTLVKKRKKLKT